MQKATSNMRIDGLDVARGVALLAMASYHFSWDLELFGYLERGTAASGFLKYYARGIATSFLFLVGFSLVLATFNGVNWPSFFKRIALVGSAALIISISTLYAIPEGWIFFGILHHIVFASVIGLLFIRLSWIAVLMAAVVAFAMPYLDLVTTNDVWLSFIGFYEIAPNSNDFVPLFPWLSASLLGIAAAKILVKKSWLEFFAKQEVLNAPARQLKFLGKHSLLFYILHQPVLIGIVWLAAQIFPPIHMASNFQIECKAACSQKFSEIQCNAYCNCFENELQTNAAQWTQLPATDQSEAISQICAKLL